MLQPPFKRIIIILFMIFIVVGHSYPVKAVEEKFSIALTGKYPPFSFYSHEGELVGFDVDIAGKIASFLNRELVIVTTEWDGILAGLLAGKYHAIIGSMAITEERAKKVCFSHPYYASGAQLFIHQKNYKTLKNIKDLGSRKVGVNLGETYEHYLTGNFPEVQVITYKSSVDIFQDMVNKRIDGFVTDRLVGLYQIKHANMPFVAAGPLLYEENMGIPVTKENKELLSLINRALESMERNGELKALHQKWFVKDRDDTPKTSGAMSSYIIFQKLVRGFYITLLVAIVSLVIGFLAAIPWGVILNNKGLWLYHPARIINDFIRGTPLLIQLFFVYFGAPQIGIKLTPLQSAIFTLAVSSASYMAEVVRSGLMSVDRGQTSAAKALGLNKMQTFRFIIWPQAFRIAIPPLMNSIVAFLKDTALISIISVSEVVREAQSIISVTFNPMKYYFIVCLMFFVFTFPLMKMADRLEEKIKKRGFAHD